MNKFAFLLLSCVTLWGFEFHTYKNGVSIQKKTGKIIMIDVMRTGCHYCENMEKNVFQDKELSSLIEKKFIPVKINLAEDEFSMNVNIDFTPTFLFIDKEGEIIKKIPGSWSVEDFKFLIRKIK